MAGEPVAAGLAASALGIGKKVGARALGALNPVLGGIFTLQFLAQLLSSMKGKKPGAPLSQAAEDAKALATLSDYKSAASFAGDLTMKPSAMTALQLLESRLSPGNLQVEPMKDLGQGAFANIVASALSHQMGENIDPTRLMKALQPPPSKVMGASMGGTGGMYG